MAAQMYYIRLFKLPLHSLATFGRTATNNRARISCTHNSYFQILRMFPTLQATRNYV
ncbi:hypothetical protein PILCRDRAFT_192153 [Piloderma croceum F 1598]|uniref:Uncharacterized protein n=1 Tax=Piloderma croceum (strain F 1598) TaxID=765440 RepID=A0A0C3CIY2_PILCF|nr:hypothetical protein PILCRDRAFT_192153 [Piloderma croceum F 1598]